jgi:predicted O-methyltransferase YrrM
MTENIDDVVHDIKPDFPEYAYLIHTLPQVLNARIIVETGLGKGDSTILFLSALSKLSNPENRKLYTFEAFMDSVYYRPKRDTVSLIKSFNFPSEWHLVNQDSIQGGKEWNDNNKIDILFLDADHGYNSVIGELDGFGLHLSDKCIIMSDDTYTSGMGGHQAPYHAMRDWAARNGPNWKLNQYIGGKGLCLLYAERSHNFGRE